MQRHQDKALWLMVVDTFAKSLLIGLAFAALVMLPALAKAENVQGLLVETSAMYEAESGTLFFQQDDNKLAPALAQSTDVNMVVTGLINRVRVSQTFSNASDNWAEAIYVFPLPENAAVDHLRMIIGERVIEGEIHEKQKAKQIYQQAKQDGKKASLIEQQRPNIFTTKVANIGPHESIRIEIEYQQTVSFDTGTFSLRFPMVVAPRFIPGPIIHVKEDMDVGENGFVQLTPKVADAHEITPPTAHPSEGVLNPVSLTVTLNAGMPLKSLNSLYHTIAQEAVDGDTQRLTLADKTVPADRDFVLQWQLAPGNEVKAAHFVEEHDGEKFGLLFLMPPQQAMEKSSIPRELVFIIDVSGSMGGTSIRQAKSALEEALTYIGDNDTFNIIPFSNSASALFANSQTRSETSIEKARRFVQGLEAGGGTNIDAALQLAFQISGSDSRLTQIVMMTDGSVGNEKQLFDLINARLQDRRLFTVGIGSAPNSFFMREAANAGRGTFSYIGDVNEVQAEIRALNEKLRSPVLRDLAIDWQGMEVEAYPHPIPDVYAGQPLMFAYRIAQNQQVSKLTVNGQLQNSPWQFDVNLAGSAKAEGVHVLWARRKIQSVENSRFLGVTEETIRREIIDTALMHHLVSRHTSLVAVDKTPSRPMGENLHTKKLKNNLPAGWDYKKVFGNAPQTATGWLLPFLSGLVLLVLAPMVRIFGRVFRSNTHG